ncbi:Cytochrome oxidase biogenesis protein Cox11-CtaG, copper delivery to Cox1 [Rhodovulum sp. PH10]|nr:cytochrome c oxidase assembly protein [Rhodovulum sp. PH10]EJW11468.1 Cytochrome oxidase biogenesis protein Cox11-CtaG, copper delivery to Cox1 [Rhodovulum sp. PH10]
MKEPSSGRPDKRAMPRLRRDVGIALACGAFVGLMVGAAYAAVPFYTWFCRVTGFGGTPQIAELAPSKVLDRRITVRFDSNVAPGLPWRFLPEKTAIDMKVGEVVTAYYRVVNTSGEPTSGTAGYNVAPTTTGAYFTKINCFCFTEQSMAPHETREMAVVFFVDPSIADDPDQDDLSTITLSYTFYPTRNPSSAATGGTTGARGGSSG